MATTTNTSLKTVSTTLPIIGDNLKHIHSDRLILRPLLLSDLEAFRILRTEAAAMSSSTRGRPDKDGETEDYLQHLQSPFQDSRLYYGIFLKKDDGNEGDLIGDGGVHKILSTQSGWPEFGYKFREKYWNKGYATEFAKAFMKYWWSLPRKQTTLQVHPASVNYLVTPKVTEQVCAWTKSGNKASEKVLQKVGFESFQGFNNGLHNWRLIGHFFVIT